MASKNATPTHRGFDSFYGFYNGEQDYYDREYCPTDAFFVNGTYHDRTRLCGLDLWNGTARADPRAGEYSTPLLGAAARRVVAAFDRARPLFLYLAFQAAHTPLQAPPPGDDDDDDACAREGVRAVFCRMVKAVDDEVAALVGALEPIWNDTLLLAVSDNGAMPPFLPVGAPLTGWESVGSNGALRAGKSTFFDGGMRVGGFLAGGALPPGARGTRYAGSVFFPDLTATLLDAAGATDGVLDGASLWPALREGDAAAARDGGAAAGRDGAAAGRGGDAAGRDGAAAALSPALVPEDTNAAAPAPRDTAAAPNPRVRVVHVATPDDPLDECVVFWEENATTTWKMMRGRQLYDGYYPVCHQSPCPRTKAADPFADLYLFDVARDPTETTNHAASRPGVVAILDAAAARAGAVAPQANAIEPAGLPFLHGGYWAPFLDGGEGAG